VKGKLSPRYIGPFPILEKCGTVAYKLELPLSLVGVYDIFHLSQLKKCLKAPMDVVLLKVAPLKAYKLELSLSLVGVYDIFHLSQLKKCLKAPVDVVLPKVAPLKADLTYSMHLINILDQKSRVTGQKMIKFFKIQWSNNTAEEATWESEGFLCSCHLDFELP
jgi:hypothetical protein